VMPYPTRIFRNLSGEEIEAYSNRFSSHLVDTVQRYQPQLIHSHHLWILTSLVKRLFPHIAVVASCHGSDLRQYDQCPHLRRQVGSGCQLLDAILTLSPEQKSQIVKQYRIPPDQIYVTGGGYDEAIFYGDSSPVNSKQTVILYAGKLSRAKGVPWLLKALIGLSQHTFHLHLVGGGSGKEYDACLREAEHLKNRVTVHGIISQQRLANLMRQSDVFVLPSLHEGLPLVVLEALACDCQVIATDLPGTRDIQQRLSCDNLVLVDKPLIRDIDATELVDERRFIEDLKAAITSWISDQSRASKNMINLEYYSWSKVFQRIEKIWFESTAR
ncbi:MAG: glycosyltransferase, partial [Desulfobacterales bacterium]|nr:glycosyltransferase [Desulfobacterales bacterium]